MSVKLKLQAHLYLENVNLNNNGIIFLTQMLKLNKNNIIEYCWECGQMDTFMYTFWEFNEMKHF